MIKHQRSRKILQQYQKTFIEIKNLSHIVSLIAGQIDSYPQIVELTSIKFPEFNRKRENMHQNIENLLDDTSKNTIPQSSTNELSQLLENKFKILMPYIPSQCFTLAMLYIDKVTKVSTVSLMIAFKYYCETQELLRNSDFSRLIGVDCKELLSMELAFLGMLEYKTYVSHKEFVSYKKSIQLLLPKKQETEISTKIDKSGAKGKPLRKISSKQSMQSDHSHDTTISEQRLEEDMHELYTSNQHFQHDIDSSDSELFDCLENLESLF
ncbi:cyclin2 related protein [Stylonychia lemnae]|uniref:Cyclin2 related protein n=1 Tax=Stylonychia lemnae TaxID=5949 RepID=A0A078AG58_STYLE|nr:cyclin2 related protein [Stylonychia lemnae]|eukprot:CDW80462.1 cyclin2 related protein [Stylonychia lemnae]